MTNNGQSTMEGPSASALARMRDWAVLMLGVLILLFVLRSCGFFEARDLSTSQTPPASGAPGRDGTTGAQGRPGAPGGAGPAGQMGPAGVNGTPGKQGAVGPPGRDAEGIGFGQGRIQVGACDSSVDVGMRSYWNTQAAEFYVHSVTLSNLAAACDGRNLQLVLLDGDGAELVSLTAVVEIVGDSMSLVRLVPAYQSLSTIASVSVASVALEIS